MLEKIGTKLKSALGLLKGKEKRTKNRRGIPVIKLGPNRRWIIFLWVLLMISVILGIYNNFTAVDTKTVIEKQIVEEKLKDTNALESFVEEFAAAYHSWSNTAGDIKTREDKISGYMTEDLAKVNKGMVTTDCPTEANVQDVHIWSLSEITAGEYDISYSVTQELTEGGNTAGEDISDLAEPAEGAEASSGDRKAAVTETENFFTVRVHMSEDGSMVIIRNPTACAAFRKSSYVPAEKETDGSVNAKTSAEIEEFLNTFFGLYPSATAKELSYYVKDGALPAIGKDYVFAGMERAVYYEEDGQIKAEVYVTYLDQEAKISQVFQYRLILEKEDNWKITGAE